MMRLTSVLSAIVMTVGCSMCGNAVVAEIPSPKGDKRAVVFQRDCGATTRMSTQVSILSRGQSLRDEGNAFIADDTGNVLAIDVRWASNDELMIYYPARARVFRHNTKVDAVTIRYDHQKTNPI